MSEIAEISNDKPVEERVDKHEETRIESAHDSSEEEESLGAYDDHDVYVAPHRFRGAVLTDVISTKPFPILPGEEEETHQLTVRYALNAR